MNKSVGIIITIAVLAAVGIGAFVLTGNNDDATAPVSSDTAQSQTTPANADEKMQQMAESDQTLDITMTNFEYSQNTINAKPGETITVNLSVGSGSHDFVIDELNVQSETLGGSSTGTVTFTVPEDAAGETYAFYCSIGNHRSLGMEGQLVISQ